MVRNKRPFNQETRSITNKFSIVKNATDKATGAIPPPFVLPGGYEEIQISIFFLFSLGSIAKQANSIFFLFSLGSIAKQANIPPHSPAPP